MLIVHVYPDSGGIGDYGKIMSQIYKLSGLNVQTIEVGIGEPPKLILEKVLKLNPGVVHFEIGGGQNNLFWASRELLKRGHIKQFVTIHDPTIVINNPSGLEIPKVNYFARLIFRIARKAINTSLRYLYVTPWRKISKLHIILLRDNLAYTENSFYLPHPTFHAEPPQIQKTNHDRPRIGFAGYWSRDKGITTLLEAYALLMPEPGFDLVVTGTAFVKDDFSNRVATLARATDPRIALTGGIPNAELDQVLQSFDAIVLPYWPENPAGVSGMATRAAELGVPLIVSDIPLLRVQLGDHGAIYTTPKDPRALANAITKYIDKPNKYKELAEKNKHRLFDTNGWDVVALELRKIIMSVIG